MARVLTTEQLESNIKKAVYKILNESLTDIALNIAGAIDGSLGSSDASEDDSSEEALDKSPIAVSIPAAQAIVQSPSGLAKPKGDVVNQVANMAISKAPFRNKFGKWAYDQKRVMPFGFNKYGGVCATGVAQILSKIFGIHDYANGNIGNGGRNIASNKHFKKVASTNASAGYADAQPGDVAVFKNHMHAAICLDGTTWASDTIQNRLDCYSGRGGTVDIYRYVGNNNQNQLAEGLADLAMGIAGAIDGDLGNASEDDSSEEGNTSYAQGTSQVSSQPQNVSKNAQIISDMLSKDLQWPKCSIAAILGIMKSESGVNPAACNKAEKNGTFTRSSANGAGYGAGLIQWSNGRKQKVLSYVGMQGKNVEDLPLETQVKMIEAEMHHLPNLNAALQQCTTIEQATALLYKNYVGGFSNSGTIPSGQELAAMSQKYQNVNRSRNSGYSSRLANAQSFMNLV